LHGLVSVTSNKVQFGVINKFLTKKAGYAKIKKMPPFFPAENESVKPYG